MNEKEKEKIKINNLDETKKEEKNKYIELLKKIQESKIEGTFYNETNNSKHTEKKNETILGIKLINTKKSKWDLISNYGDLIEGTKIIPLKSPKKDHSFSPLSFYELQKTEFNRHVNFLIDLNDENTLYTEDDLPKEMRKINIPCIGGNVPHENCMMDFYNVMEYINEKYPDSYIGVHCKVSFF
jgi:hypothetical protein